MNTPEYPQPLISVDIVPLTLVGGTLSLILGRRIYEPYLNEFALPGVLLGVDETLKEGAKRALRVKTKVSGHTVTGLFDVGAFDSSNRDPRGATVSIAYIATVIPDQNLKNLLENPEESGVTLVSIADVVTGNKILPFDHNDIVKKALETVTEKFLTSKEFTQSLLGDTFTTKTVRSTIDVLAENTDNGVEFNRHFHNLTRNLKATGWVAQNQAVAYGDTTETSRTYDKGRPSSSWSWTQ